MKIKYFAWLKNITGIEFEDISNENIKDIKSLKFYLAKKYPDLKKYIIEEDIIRVAINLEYSVGNQKLDSSDEIALFPPVSGG